MSFYYIIELEDGPTCRYRLALIESLSPGSHTYFQAPGKGELSYVP